MQLMGPILLIRAFQPKREYRNVPLPFAKASAPFASMSFTMCDSPGPAHHFDGATFAMEALAAPRTLPSHSAIEGERAIEEARW